MFKTVEEIKNYQKSIKPLNDSFIHYYLNTIYQNLLIREESPNVDINEFNNKNIFSNTQKQKANEKGISFRNFLQYLDIQEFMCERIFNYLDKSKTGKLSKTEFVNGLIIVFFGNISELYKMTFYICDFNENNKIHKFNMKLILSYIPVKTYEEQQEYIKKINSIINNYFTELDQKYPELNIKVDKEINFDLYKKSIEEYINNSDKQDYNNFNNNGSYLLFINLISYIYLNHPFITENMNYCDFIKNKFLMKVQHNRNRLPNTERNNSIKLTTSSKKVNEVSIKTTLFDIKTQRDRKIDGKELFQKGEKKPRANSLHNSKIIKKIDKKKEQNLPYQLSDEELKIINSYKDKNLSDNKASNNIKNQKVVAGCKLSSPRQNKDKNIINYSSNKNDKDNENILIIEEEDINNNNNTNNNNINNINIKEESEYSDIVYKYCEEDNSKYIKKYFAIIKGKEILFFTSKLKNELCSIWSISKTIIIIKDKTNIGKYTYYPIKFINYNRSFYEIYFEEQEKQKIFAKKCEESTNFLKIEEFFEFKEKIGAGHFGVVKKCIEKSSGKEYAVKIMNKNKIKDRDLNFLIQERNYMCLIKHPNIVSLVRDFEDEKCIYFVMEYFKGGDLSKYLHKIREKKEKSLERISAKIIKIIAQGVEYLNQFGIVHRDLKPENIVFEKENDIKSIKIIDLGVAITLPYGKQSSDPIGTLAYIAPEMYTHKPYSYKVDVWSIGILLYYLASGGAVPFDDEKMDESIMGKKVVFTHQEYPEKYFGDKSKSLITLLDKMLEKNDSKRISIKELIKDNWFEIIKK